MHSILAFSKLDSSQAEIRDIISKTDAQLNDIPITHKEIDILKSLDKGHRTTWGQCTKAE